MDKKAEKQIEIILTPDDEGGRQASESELPALVPPTVVPDQVTGDSGSACVKPVSIASEHAATSKSEAGGTPAPPDDSNTPSKRSKSAKYGTALTVALVVGLFMLSLPIKQAVYTYANAERPAGRQAAVFFPSILSAWFGDADSSYALQTLPTMLSLAGNKNNAESRALRNNTIETLRRYWHSGGDSEKDFSRLLGTIALSSSGDAAESVRQIRPIMKRAENSMLNLYCAILMANSGDLAGAVQETDEGLRLSNAGKGQQFVAGDPTIFYAMKARLYQTMGKPEDALAVLNSAACSQAVKENHKAHSDRADGVLFGKAWAYLQLGQPDKAISLFSSTRKDTKSILGIAYLMKNNIAKALSEADLTPPNDHGKRQILLSRIYCKQGKFDQSLVSANQAEQQSPNLIALEQRVFVLNKLGRYKEALAISAHFEEQLSPWLEGEDILFRVLPDLHAGRAEAYLKTGDFANALQETQLALKMNGTLLRALQVANQASLGLRDRVSAAAYENRINAIPLLPTYR